MSASLPCPICGVLVPFDSPEMPFCSDRCRSIDLGNWATEKYRIGTEAMHEIEEEDGRQDEERER